MKESKINARSLELSRWRRKISKRLKKVWAQWYRLESTQDALNAGRCELLEDLSAWHFQSFPPPVFHGRQPNDPVSDWSAKTWAPIRVVRHRNVRVIGWSNFLLHGRVAVHPDLYAPSRDRSPLELYASGRMSKDFTDIRIRRGLLFGSLPKAINLCDQTPYNYAHWMTEILPRLVFLSEKPELRDWPILVDDGIGQNLFESMQAVLPWKAEFIKLPSHEMVQVGELLNVSPTSYCPHEFRDFHKAQQQGFQFFFSGQALNRLRDRLRERYQRYTTGRPRRIYLKRTPLWTYNNRNVADIDSIEDLLDARGIETLNVTGMTIQQQAKVFMNAEVVVAPTGAALINMLFAPAGCRILVLAAAYEGATYDYFHHIAHLLGHELSFVVGPQEDEDGYHMNRDFRVSLDDLRSALDLILSVPRGCQLRTG